MKSLPEYLWEKRINADEDILMEGIFIDDKTKKVRLNDSSKGVDFNGPIYWKTEDGLDVISIFKRTSYKDYSSGNEYDGNPFIYALKNKYRWKFDVTKAQAHKYLKQFVSNCQKLQKKYDTIIMIPSYSQVNKRFMETLYNMLNAECKMEHLFTKVEIDHDEVEQFIDYDAIAKDYEDTREVEQELERILYSLNGSDKKFEAKSVNKKYLKYIKFLQINDDPESVEQINGKNILILDDVFSSGATISQAVNAISQNYAPKSITVVTLLSNKQD